MKINVAGAGAGKTTRMADFITTIDIPVGEVVFCIAFTNSAVENIREKVIEKEGGVPNNIKISTIHSFFYNELIKPYFFILYGKHFDRVSMITLPSNEKYRRRKISELEADGFLHITTIPERAKWVAYKKSSDRKTTCELRKQILHNFNKYCNSIFVDEAQDIDEDMRLILESLDNAGVDIVLYGDPKQDVKGYGQFSRIIEKTKEVNYISESYRCPRKLLQLSNMLASDFEKQTTVNENKDGSIQIVFESNIENLKQFLAEGDYGLRYISRKNERINTHDEEKNVSFENLQHEVYRAMVIKWKGKDSDLNIKRWTFYVTERMLEEFDGKNAKAIVSRWINEIGVFDYTREMYASLIGAFGNNDDNQSSIPVVQSIEIVKGLEAENCLFILTTDLAPYLFRNKDQENKTKHLLYVALTRSLSCLTILITKEVEAKYTKSMIEEFFAVAITLPNCQKPNLKASKT